MTPCNSGEHSTLICWFVSTTRGGSGAFTTSPKTSCVTIAIAVVARHPTGGPEFNASIYYH
jgi:hypothetical protein